MDDWQMNPLKTGALFVAPGQIMDPGIMKMAHRPDHLSRLEADVGLDALEAELAFELRDRWSLRRLLERIAKFFYRGRPAST